MIPLDPEQQRAVESEAPRIRVQAGAGSGKTRTLVARVIWLVQHGTPPTSICVITFSKKAAEELQRRLPPETAGVQVGTIHSLGYYVLRSERRFRKVADEAMTRRLIRDALRAQEQIQDADTLPAFSECCAQIGRAKSLGLPFSPMVFSIAVRYQELLRVKNLFDFDDLVIEPVALFQNHEDVARRWAGRYGHLLIDEGQDTSRLQWEFLTGLVSEETQVFIVCDPQQSMYSWRGADVDSLLHLDERFPGPAFVDYALSTNYRSVERIVGAANAVSQKLKRGSLHLTEHRQPGEGPVIHRLPAVSMAHDVTALIAEQLKAEYARGVAWSEMAVLYRLNACSEALEAACSKAGIPYIVVGGMGFYGRAEVKDVLAYLRLTQGLHAESIERIYYKPARYLGKVWLAEVARGGGWEAFLDHQMAFSKPAMQRRADEFRETLSDLLALHDAQPVDVVRYVRHRLGYQEWIVGEEPDLMDEVVLDTLDALEEGAGRWRSVSEFLAFAGLCQRTAGSADPRRHEVADRLSLSTIHRAKGLEWPVVVVYGLSHQTFPHYRNDIEEERRILYVAVTRARDRLYFATSGGAPSAYWHELRTVHDLAIPAPRGMPASLDDPDCPRDPAGHLADDAPPGDCAAVERDPGTGGPDDGLGALGGAAERDLGGVPVDVAADRGTPDP